MARASVAKAPLAALALVGAAAAQPLTGSLGFCFHQGGQSRSLAFSVLLPGPSSGASAECHSPHKEKVHLGNGGPVGIVFNALPEGQFTQHVVDRLVADAMQPQALDHGV